MSLLKTFLVSVLLVYWLGLVHGSQLGSPVIQEDQGLSKVAGDEGCGTSLCGDPECQDADKNEHAKRRCSCNDVAHDCIENWCIAMIEFPGVLGFDPFFYETACHIIGFTAGDLVEGAKFSCFRCSEARDAKK